ncbi:UNVERIFIED_CONTAM: hypothetical protein RMT77_006107 [Armadillidium vulgare]
MGGGVVGNNEEMLLEEGGISREEVEVAVGKVKKEKSAGMDGMYGEMIRVGAEEMADWLVRMFNVLWGEERVPQEWQDACIVPIYISLSISIESKRIDKGESGGGTRRF